MIVGMSIARLTHCSSRIDWVCVSESCLFVIPWFNHGILDEAGEIPRSSRGMTFVGSGMAIEDKWKQCFSTK